MKSTHDFRKFLRSRCGRRLGSWLILQLIYVQFLFATVGCQTSDSEWRHEKVPTAEALGIEVVTPTSQFTADGGRSELRGDVPTDDGVKRFGAILDFELGLYPPELLNKAGFQRLVLCKDLTRVGRVKPPAGCAVPHRGVIYIDVDTMAGFHHPELLHHEIFHLIDYADGGVDFTDESWDCLPTTRDAAISDKSPTTVAMMGMVSLYSATSTAEDKAEVFSSLMADPLLVEYVAERDPLVGNKAKQIVKRLKEFCSECDDDFWSRVRQQRINDPDYKQYSSVLLGSIPVYLVDQSTALENAALALSLQSSTVKRLETSLNGADFALLDMYSRHNSHPPHYQLGSSSGNLIPGGSLSLRINGFHITHLHIATELVRELTETENIQLPVFMDLMYGPESVGGPMAWFVSIHPPSEVAAK